MSAKTLLARLAPEADLLTEADSLHVSVATGMQAVGKLLRVADSTGLDSADLERIGRLMQLLGDLDEATMALIADCSHLLER